MVRALRRTRHFGLLTGRAAWHVASRHYFSLLSAAVLGVLAFLVLTSDSFESQEPAGRRDATSTQNKSDAALALQPRPRRPSILFYVVQDDRQRDAIAAAVSSDRFAFTGGTPPVDYIVYLVAGTQEEEARTIDRLNFEEWAAQQNGVDMRVIDVRGRFD